MKIGVGYADLLGISDIVGRTMQLGIAQALSPSLVLIEETSAILGGVADRDSDRRFEYLDLSIGLLWNPFSPRPQPSRTWLPYRFNDSSALYLKPMVGLAFRTVADPDPSQTSTSSRGPVGTLTVGYVPLQGWDYDFGIEVRGKATLMEGELRYHLDYLVVVSLRH